jgi:formylglycine-generating enzyme required for sulfatase activity
MLSRTALALLLLLQVTASAQEPETARSALVRISGTRNGTPVRGTGFVVGLEGGKAMIVTAAHVIEGVQSLEVTFAVDPTESYPAGAMLGHDANLAVFPVRGALPAGVTALSFEVASRPRDGEELLLRGFPQMELAPRVTRRVLSARRGTLLLIDQGVGEGFSGGPVLQDGKVVGVVTDADDQTTYAVNAVVAQEALEGLGVKLGGTSGRCVPGEEHRENGIVFVRICPGAFTMGSAANDPQAGSDEKPAHQVTLSEFWIGKTEITNEQYRRYRSDHQGEDSLPATHVSWEDAEAACRHFGGRLPTEAEWEYAARAGSQTAWSFGDDEKRLGEYAWYDKSSDDTSHPVGMKKPNAWGLYDMHGNVEEWLADWFGPYPSVSQSDPAGPTTGTSRVLRGGEFRNPPGDLRSARRSGGGLVNRVRYTGFRCARSLRRQP